MKFIFIKILFSTALCFVAFSSLTNAGGPPAARTNAPGESNCTSCHGGTLQTSGTLFNAISLSVAGTTLANLIENTNYSFSLTFANASSARYGFQLCVLPSGASPSSASVGTLSSPTSETQIVTAGNRSYIQHTSSGTSPSGGSKTWNFNWQAPPAFTGNVTFYVIVNSSNNNSASSGDAIIARTFSATVALPVTWLYVNGKSVSNQTAIIQWATSSEENNAVFEIEKSSNRKDWNSIGFIKGNGTTNKVSSYEFTDIDFSSDAYYRIKQIDFDGQFDFSNIIFISDIEMKEETVLSTIALENKINCTHTINRLMVSSLNGELLLDIYPNATTVELPDFPQGVYLVKAIANGETIWTKIIK